MNLLYTEDQIRTGIALREKEWQKNSENKFEREFKIPARYEEVLSGNEKLQLGR